MERRLPFIRSPFVTLAKLQVVLVFAVLVLLSLAPLVLWLKGLLILAALALCLARISLLRRRWLEFGEMGGLRIDPAQSLIRLDKGAVSRLEDVADCRVSFRSSYLVVLAVERSPRRFPGGLRCPRSWHMPVFAGSLSSDDFRRLSAMAFASANG